MLGKTESDELVCYFYKNRDSVVAYHRVNGPAYSLGYSLHYIGGMLHNLNGPVYLTTYSSEYAICDKDHCITGPDRICIDSCSWHINGVEYTEEEFNRIMKIC